jgi:uncharacterized protein (TIGR00255 family)
MTGYGRGEAARDGYKVTIELSSVNRKQSEIVVNLPRELEPLEARLRDQINRCIARGRLSVRVAWHAADETWKQRAHVNLPLAKAYAAEFARLATALKLDGGVSLEALLRVPGVVRTVELEEDAEALWPLLEAALKRALTALLRTRQREGSHLAKDLKTRMEAMRRQAAVVEERAPLVAESYRAQLLARIREAGLAGIPAEDERMLKEVVFFADRSDITEELTRLQSHFRQFGDCLKSAEPVGRMLDFLAQEIGREINTIGSKANDPEISRTVVMLKTELEKFREQAQNVE